MDHISLDRGVASSLYLGRVFSLITHVLNADLPNNYDIAIICTMVGGGGGWNAIRYHILDPLKIKYQISDTPKKSNIRYLTPKYLTQKKNQIFDP